MTDTTLRTTLRPKLPKPEKPWPDFPLYWHPRGYWMKRYQGLELRYEADAIKSHERWQKDRVSMDSGGDTSKPRKRYTLRDVVNLYLTRQKRRLDEGDLSPAHFTKCRAELEFHLPKALSLNTPLESFRAKDPTDDSSAVLFQKIRSKCVARGLNAAAKHITIVRAAMDFAVGKRLMLPPSYGDDFDPPSAKRIAAERFRAIQIEGERTWTAEELRTVLKAADDLRTRTRKRRGEAAPENAHLYAQILLGLFAAYGSDDICAIPERALDLKTGVLKGFRAKDPSRPTLAIMPARVVEAIKFSVAHRSDATVEDAGPLMFRTVTGRPCNLASETKDECGILKTIGRNDTIAQNFKRLLKKIGLKKTKTGFKALRAACRTMLAGGGIHEDIIAVMMGRNFRYKVDDYYVRGDLRAEMTKAAEHIESVLFPNSKVTKPVKQTHARRKGSRAVAS